MTPVNIQPAYTGEALKTGRESWGNLNFFICGAAQRVAAHVDEQVLKGAHVVPPPEQVFAALRLTPPEKVRAVILGQDPYPTPGDAHGLAFSVANPERRLPASLKTIYEALKADLGIKPPAHGNLTRWAQSGILLLNVSLTVEAGKANSHKNTGWAALANEVLQHLNRQASPIVFMLWGSFAHKAGEQLDTKRHCVIKTVHPSPLARGSGPQHRFVAAKPFAAAQDWCLAHGLPPIDWYL